MIKIMWKCLTVNEGQNLSWIKESLIFSEKLYNNLWNVLFYTYVSDILLLSKIQLTRVPKILNSVVGGVDYWAKSSFGGV